MPPLPFIHDKTLLNPTFESYQLSSDVIKTASIVTFPTSSLGKSLKHSNEARLGWREARNRANWNHLAVKFDVGSKEVGWVDGDGSVWLAKFDKSSKKPSTRQIWQIPELEDDDNVTDAYYPALIHLQADTWLVADGIGRLFLLAISETTVVRMTATLPSPSTSSPLPFRLHAAKPVDGAIEAIISSTPGSNKASKSASPTSVHLVRFALDVQGDTTAQPVWTVQAIDPPGYAHRMTDGRWILGAEAAFKSSLPAVAKPEPTAVESAAPTQPTSLAYIWVQDSECCTLTWQLPASITAKHIKVTFSPRYLSVVVEKSASGMQDSELPRIPHKELHAPINVQASTWMFDAEDHTLVVNLEKLKEDSAKWPHLFSPASLQPSDPDETFSAEQLDNMANVLSHLTNDDANGDSNERPLLTSSLLDEDEAGDDEAMPSGNVVIFTAVDAEGQIIRITPPTEILSSAVPIAGDEDSQSGSVIATRGYDGLYYEPAWTHKTTYPALSYVLASKRSLNLRFILHWSTKVCIAIESGGNVWCYFPPAPGTRAKTASQCVHRLDDELGSVLGCAGIPGIGLVLLAAKGLCVLEGILS